MSDTTPPTSPDSIDSIVARLAASETAITTLRDEAKESRDHRTTMRAYLTIAGVIVSALGTLVLVGAVTTRDITLSTSGRLDAVTARVERVEDAASRKDLDDRTTRDAIVRLQSTLETLQSTVVTRLEAIEQHLPRTAVR